MANHAQRPQSAMLFDGEQVHASHSQLQGKRMPEVVEIKTRDVCLARSRLECLAVMALLTAGRMGTLALSIHRTSEEQFRIQAHLEADTLLDLKYPTDECRQILRCPHESSPVHS